MTIPFYQRVLNDFFKSAKLIDQNVESCFYLYVFDYYRSWTCLPALDLAFFIIVKSYDRREGGSQAHIGKY